jgi:hypothetical protein
MAPIELDSYTRCVCRPEKLMACMHTLLKFYWVPFSGLHSALQNADAGFSLLPAGVLVSHIFSIGYLSFVAGHTIYRSYLALPPSSGTRHREPLRRGYVQAFSILSFVSLASAAFFAVRFSSLSYQVWALERGIELPERFVILNHHLVQRLTS